MGLSDSLSISHTMNVATAVERLRNRHGGPEARKLALREQRKARRARCRKRFNFWAAVADQVWREVS